MAKKSEFAFGFSFSALSFSLLILQHVCCSAARSSCTLYNNNALKMYFPELGDDERNALVIPCVNSNPKTGANEIQVNWLLPFSQKSRCLLFFRLGLEFCFCFRSIFFFNFLLIFVNFYAFTRYVFMCSFAQV